MMFNFYKGKVTEITEGMVRDALLNSKRYTKIVDTMSIEDIANAGVFDFKNIDSKERKLIIDWAEGETNLIPKTIVDFFGESKIKEVYGNV